jgi:FkbM family methyltransferase
MTITSSLQIVGAQVPVAMEVPEPMCTTVAEVLGGEYEAGFFGEGLTILDLGANVGSFSLWANMRWPASTIHAYEPHPGTFDILARNVARFPNIHANNVAVYPSDGSKLTLFARYVGDGEAGVAEAMKRTFAAIKPEQTFPVTGLHPAKLPPADIVKLDVEGAEGEILRHMDLSRTELVVLEFQDDGNRRIVKDVLADGFVLEHETAYLWDDLIHADLGYRADLVGNHFGRMFFARPTPTRLRRGPSVGRGALTSAAVATAR